MDVFSRSLRRLEPRRRLRLAALALAAALPFIGAGCDWKAFVAPPRETSVVLTLKQGLLFSLRPSFLGVTGTVSDVLGAGGDRTIRVTAAEPGKTVSVDWETADEKGSITAREYAGSHDLFLPVFWKAGAAELAGNGVLWLSPEAYVELTDQGSTDVRLGLGGGALERAADLLASFNAVISRLSQSATSTAPALPEPFLSAFKGESAVFPLRIDGTIENVRVILAKSWFADYVILKNPENPLVLKVTVNPLAAEALQVFAPLKIDTRTIGYEITSISSSSSAPKP